MKRITLVLVAVAMVGAVTALQSSSTGGDAQPEEYAREGLAPHQDGREEDHVGAPYALESGVEGKVESPKQAWIVTGLGVAHHQQGQGRHQGTRQDDGAAGRWFRPPHRSLEHEKLTRRCHAGARPTSGDRR